jgi:hypothetical protein
MTLPGIAIFFLLTNIEAARGYYGCETGDIQFSVILFYAGYVGFYSLERRFLVFGGQRISLTVCKSANIQFSYLLPYPRYLYSFSCPVYSRGSVCLQCKSVPYLILFKTSSERGREISFSIFSDF